METTININWVIVMLIHEEKAGYDVWIKLVFLIPVGLVIGAVILLGKGESIGSLVMFIDAVFIFILFYFIMPRKYQIYDDRLKIVLGTPFAVNIPVSSIKEIKQRSAFCSLGSLCRGNLTPRGYELRYFAAEW